MSNKRLIIALDFKNIDEVSNFISKLDPQKCIAKVGLQLFISEGPKVLEFLSHKGFEIFLDLKLHDIPNTVKKSVEEISQYNVKLTTIHLQGGRDMIQAANEAKGDTKILGVSLLTSLDDSDTRELYNNDFKKQFDNLILAWSSPNPRDHFYKTVFGRTYAEQQQHEIEQYGPEKEEKVNG